MPNVDPYIYDVNISGFTRSSIYIYDISSLRIKLRNRIIIISSTLKSAMALREILRPKRDKVIGEWIRLCKEELYDLCTSINVIWTFRSRGRRRTGNVARMGRGEVHKRFWWGTLRERDHLEVVGVDMSIILKWIFKKSGRGIEWIDVRCVLFWDMTQCTVVIPYRGFGKNYRSCLQGSSSHRTSI